MQPQPTPAPFTLLRSTATSTNICCIQPHPQLASLFGFCFYQQHANHDHFTGGIQVITQQQLLSEGQLGAGEGYAELGPVMDMEWLPGVQAARAWLLAAGRAGDGLLLSCGLEGGDLRVELRVRLGEGMFCLYCDWVELGGGDCLAAISSSQSCVYTFSVHLPLSTTTISPAATTSDLHCYSNHNYAIWACRILPLPQPLLILGDQTNILYLYDIQTKQLLAKNTKVHEQGICEIVRYGERKVLTGGFDGVVAMVGVDGLQVRWRVQVGGTVWRVIPVGAGHQGRAKDGNNSNQNEGGQGERQYLICNSSQKQFQLAKLPSPSPILWHSSTAHASLAYAAGANPRLLITASFYDQRVCFWRPADP